MNTKAWEKICFVVCPIGKPGTDTRRRSDKILKVVKRAVGHPDRFKAVRADEIAEPGIITTHMIEHLIHARLVVADLTDANPNVYYELGIRHAVGKPFVQMIKQGQEPPFDIAAVRTISIDETRELDAMDEIERSVEAILAPGFRVTSPVSIAVPEWRPLQP